MWQVLLNNHLTLYYNDLVYQKNAHQIKISRGLLKANRVDFIAPADYSKESELYEKMLLLIDYVAAKIKYKLKLKI